MGFWKENGGSIASSTISGVFNLVSTGLFNRQSRREARKNREFAAQQQEDAQEHDMFMQAQQFGYQQQLNQQQLENQQILNQQAYEAQQHYFDRNLSVQAQRRQIEAAGLNPYLAMDGSAGTASSMPSGSANAGSVAAPSSGAVAPSSLPQLEKYDIANAMLDTIDKIKGFSLKDEEITQKAIDNHFSRMDRYLDQKQKVQDLIKSQGETEILIRKRDLLDWAIKEEEEVFDEKIRNRRLVNDEIEQSINESESRQYLNELQAEAQMITNVNLDETQKSSIALMIQQAGYYDSESDVNVWDIAEKKFDALIKGYDENGVVLTEEQISKLQDLYVDEISARVKSLENAGGNKIADTINKIVLSIIGITYVGRGLKALKFGSKATKAIKSGSSSLGDNWLP